MRTKVLLYALLIPFLGLGQGESQDLENLATPSSPAFILMDISPSTVYVPSDLKALSFQVLNGFGSGSNNGFPKNFAAEIVPFWYTNPKNLNFLTYHNIKKSNPADTTLTAYNKQDIFGDIFKKASVSFAYMDGTFEIFQTPQNYISVGVRTTLVKVNKKQDIENVLRAYESFDQFKIDFNADPNNDPTKLAEDASYVSLKENLGAAVNMTPVFKVDIAMAYSTLLNNNNSNFNDTLGRFGFWVTSDLALPFSSDGSRFIHFYAVARYIRDGLNLDPENTLFTTNVYDVGGKLELELASISLGYEYLSREGDTDNYRSLGTVRYRVSDAFTLSGGFGKNFMSGDETISLLGVKWALDTGEGVLPFPK